MSWFKLQSGVTPRFVDFSMDERDHGEDAECVLFFHFPFDFGFVSDGVADGFVESFEKTDESSLFSAKGF